MRVPPETKERLKKEITARLSEFPEVQRVVIFGSFVTSDDPHDLDIAVFQDSNESYYPLALKYRKNLRNVSKTIPLDVIPLRKTSQRDAFLTEIERGEILYER